MPDTFFLAKSQEYIINNDGHNNDEVGDKHKDKSAAGKPRVQVQRSTNAPWDSIGELQTYPATSAAQAGALVQGQQFELRLDAPAQFVAVRVLGKPSSGDRPNQSFVTCSELQAFAH